MQVAEGRLSCDFQKFVFRALKVRLCALKVRFGTVQMLQVCREPSNRLMTIGLPTPNSFASRVKEPSGCRQWVKRFPKAFSSFIRVGPRQMVPSSETFTMLRTVQRYDHHGVTGRARNTECFSLIACRHAVAGGISISR